VIQYPDWQDMIRNGGGFDTMVIPRSRKFARS
jgi:hypothetical protein